jgi:hypothetical protein
VFAPDIPTWVEQWDFFWRIGVYGRCSIGFPSVAMKTSQSQVIKHIRPTLGKRDHMVHCEAHILPLL